MTALLDSLLDEIVGRALREDLEGGDLTTSSVVAEDRVGAARAVAKTSLVVAGGDVFARVFYQVDRSLRVERLKRDGERAEPGSVLFLVEGSLRSILMAERTALNFAQHLAGIASLTRRFVDAVPEGSRLRVVDTRKTTPGLRRLEREAVRAGGGYNHRNDLGSAVLIKDNHIISAGNIRSAIASARATAPHTSRIEVEVESLVELEEALAAGAEILLLDNFAESALEEAVHRARGRALVEVSGNVTLERIPKLAALGVDVVSIGALTHSAPAADISLDLEPYG